MKAHFPFEAGEFDGQYTLLADVETEPLYPKYWDFFGQHGYTGDGYTWEGHIVQILEKQAPDLLPQLEFDSEAGSFFAAAPTAEMQARFLAILAPIFADLKTLETWVKKADRKRVEAVN